MSELDMSVTLSGIKLDNPVIPASGTFGYGHEFAELYDLNILGSIAFKGTTREARFGNPTPRIAEIPSGMINSVGLQNPGIEKVISEELPRLREHFEKPVIANISGFEAEDFVYCAERLDAVENVGILEINISCPNVRSGGVSIGACPSDAAAVTAAVKKAVKKPVYVKLTPNVTDITEIAKAAVAAGADALSMINTLTGMAIDAESQRPLLARVIGGLSGPAVKPVALRCVWETSRAVDVPILGMGGITNGQDAIEFILAGATAVAVGTSNFMDPASTVKVINGIIDYCERHGVKDINELRGALKC